MREEVLARFFSGGATATELAEDLEGSERTISAIESVIMIEDMQEKVVVTRDMLIALCDAVLREELKAYDLRVIGFALVASDKFIWDGADVIGNVIADWSCPEVTYALNVANIRRFKEWLAGRQPYPENASPTEASGRVISILRKQKLPG